MKLTTSSIKYSLGIDKRLISDFEEGWIPLWSYLERTSMLIEAHSYTCLVQKDLSKRKLLYRKWAAANQKGIGYLGIFRLDTIKIEERDLRIPLNDLYEIQNILQSDIEIQELNSFILDGMDYQLIDFKKDEHYQWKSEEQISKSLTKMINIISDIYKSSNS